jgi:CDP-diacylglycerol--glycerol-3-phosphate 3-phosphatidyltransferase
MSLFPRWIRSRFDATVAPVAGWLNALGLSPNWVTSAGALLLLTSGWAFAAGRVRLGGLLLLSSGLCDALDGKMARASGRVSAFGAFYDSTLDRVGESALFLGIALFFISGGVPSQLAPSAAAAAIVALAAGLLVSYTRARAEGLGLECKVGLVQRAERVVGLGLPSWIFGAGPQGMLLFVLVTSLAVFSSVTVVQRVIHVYRLTRGGSGESTARRRALSWADSGTKGRGGD